MMMDASYEKARSAVLPSILSACSALPFDTLVDQNKGQRTREIASWLSFVPVGKP